ncbi:unnamed protein product [Protopolystoma xenopodis]|uniref:Uncharacterized protein n=1 Tax=Protopolystoma xenopodis TaxID=117903 RepID=A0A3S5A1R1_9PLAT|nr:unnamed protein product [Protopolystoma xenopodis]
MVSTDKSVHPDDEVTSISGLQIPVTASKQFSSGFRSGCVRLFHNFLRLPASWPPRKRLYLRAPSRSVPGYRQTSDPGLLLAGFVAPSLCHEKLAERELSLEKAKGYLKTAFLDQFMLATKTLILPRHGNRGWNRPKWHDDVSHRMTLRLCLASTAPSNVHPICPHLQIPLRPHGSCTFAS